MKYLVVEFRGELSTVDQEFLEQNGVAIGASHSLLGGDPLTQLVITALVPLALKCIRDVLLKQIEKGNSVSLKTKDIDIKNVDSETLLKVLTALERK